MKNLAAKGLTLLSTLATSSALAAPRPQVLQAGKDATALVDLGERGSGTGFCVDAKGLFVTNRHVVAGLSPGGKVKLVLHAAEDAQRVVEAQVLASTRQKVTATGATLAP